MLKQVRLVVICWISIALVGCGTPTKNIESRSELEQLKGNQSIVFGRIQWLENGEEKKIGKGLMDMKLVPHFVRMEDNSRIIGDVNEKGYFTWSLSSGKYYIHKMLYRDPWTGNYFVVPKVVFNIPDDGKNYYLGTLKCEYSPKRDFLGGLSGEVLFTIHDESDQAYSDAHSKFGITSEEIENSFMVHNLRLPRSIETTDEYNLAVSIINAILFGVSQ